MYNNKSTAESQDFTANNELLEKISDKKQSNTATAEWIYKHLPQESYLKYCNCGNYLVMLEDAERQRRKLEVGFFCGQRLCAGCAWRESVRTAECIAAISQALTEERYGMLFVTLTVPNVKADKLRETIQHLGQSFKRLVKRKGFESLLNCIRKVEVTYNAERDDYHPHLHCLVFVRSTYFSGKKYISQAKLLEGWRAATRQPDITQVDIRKCKITETSNAILEISKYSAKSSEYMQSEIVFDTIYNAFYHTRLLSYTGICKDKRKEYTEGKLKKYEVTDETKYIYRVVYVYQALQNGYTEHSIEAYEPPPADKWDKIQEDKNLVLSHEIAKDMERFKKFMSEAWVREAQAAEWSNWDED